MAPFAAIKENRVSIGTSLRGIEIAGPLLSAAVLLAVLLLIIATVSFSRWRYAVYLGAGLVFFWLCIALLVHAGRFAVRGAAPRVSPALGFWGLPIASYILVNHSNILKSGVQKLVFTAALLIPPALMLFGSESARMISVLREYSMLKDRFLTELFVHLRLFSTAVLLAALIGIPLGVMASHRRRLSALLIVFVDAAQTIPSIALFGLLMAPLAALSRAVPVLRDIGIKGVGAAPALTALTLYALLPIMRNTICGLNEVPQAVTEVGSGMGMTANQLFLRVRWPMALPGVLAGLRTASVQAVGNTTVAALIGAGGLGMLIFQGLGQAAPDLILSGVIPLIVLAAAVDRLWDWLSHIWVPPGISGFRA
ncbi:MAG: hypothetical protein B0D92_03135 [Spirochaeta sp. LUC14_002_19_P3]|nr:MAG: hypothetical protein B0D92_03135 [Spirochaeta sp. LUC14_002_19_P3]